MTNFAALLRRELGVYFVSPLAYIILSALLLVTGLVFVADVGRQAASGVPLEYQVTLSWTMYVIVLTSALVTMRLIAEEKSRGTIEIALTAPVTEAQFVLAKFAAAMVLQIYLVVFTVGFLVLISPYGQVDWGAAACGYLGILLVGALMYSVGLLISSLCTSQITAGILTFTVSVLLLVATIVGAFLAEGDPRRALLSFLDLNATFGDFLKGVLDTSRLVYLLSASAFFLFVTTRVVESRRWR